MVVTAGATMETVAALDTAPPDAGLETVTGTLATAAMSAAEMAAWSCVALTYVVVLAAPFHCTPEQGTKFVPVTLSVNAPVPAVTVAGDTAVIAGVDSDPEGPEIVNEAALELTPKLETVTLADPAKATSAGEMEAVSCAELANAVVRAEPFQLTTEVFRKFAPFTTSGNGAELQDGTVAGESDAIDGGAIVNEIDAADVPPPGPRVNTAT